MVICSATASATSPGSLALKQLRSDSEQREIDDFEEEERRIMSQDSGPQDSQVGFLAWPKISKFIRWKNDLTLVFEKFYHRLPTKYGIWMKFLAQMLHLSYVHPPQTFF